MKKLIVAILIISGIFFLWGNKLGLADDKEFSRTTQVAEEERLDAYERLQRMIYFREAVEKAKLGHVSPDNYVSLETMPVVLKNSIVATEDKRFFEHGALDFFSIARALYTNTVSGETLEGGSTITQQTVKNLFLSSQRTWERKLEEMVLSYLMEYHYSKNDILEIYMNTIYYGNNYYGIKLAAQGYFGKRVGELSVPQIAMLAGMPQAPSYYNPYENFDVMKKRQYTVLSLMATQNIIPLDHVSKYYEQDLHLRKP